MFKKNKYIGPKIKGTWDYRRNSNTMFNEFLPCKIFSL